MYKYIRMMNANNSSSLLFLDYSVRQTRVFTLTHTRTISLPLSRRKERQEKKME